MQSRRPSQIGLLLSGGIDSAILLNQLLCSGSRVVPFYVTTECVWQDCELRSIRRLLQSMSRRELAELVVLDMPVSDLYGEHWSISGYGAPSSTTSDEAVFLPGRNPLLLLKPMLWCQMHHVPQLALATLAANPFDDATPSFFSRFENALREATGDLVTIVRPFENLYKHQILELARDMPLELTFSCLAPVGDLHCGRCNKCAERRAAFLQLGMADKTAYAEPAPDLCTVSRRST